VADIRVGSQGKLKEYRRKRHKFPLSLATGPQDKDTTTFMMLAAECMGPKSKRQKGKDWVSMGTWKLIAQTGVSPAERPLQPGSGKENEAQESWSTEGG
jgi:hypothetical protein